MAAEFLPVLDIHAPRRQRRLTVLVRWLLLIPQFVVLFVLGIVTFFVLVISWFAALALGRLPDWSADYLGGYLAYYHRVWSYQFLLVDTYPPFGWQPEGYPVAIRLAPGQLNRLAVLFRIILAIPALIIADVVVTGLGALSFFIWLVVLILGRTPLPVFGAVAAVQRYVMRTQAYLTMLTSAYPKTLFGEREMTPVEEVGSDTRPLVLSSGARALLIVFIVLGVLSYFGGGDAAEQTSNNNPGPAASTTY